MNREIKFRAWDIINKRILNYVDIMTLPMWEVFPGTPEQRPFEVMQYVGFKDYADKEIYEGDIVKCTGTPASLKPTFIGIVKYKLDRFCIEKKDGRFVNNGLSSYIIKVIGNIYENPDLLNDKKC